MRSMNKDREIDLALLAPRVIGRGLAMSELLLLWRFRHSLLSMSILTKHVQHRLMRETGKLIDLRFDRIDSSG